MIGQSVKLTRIRRIGVGVHYSWFLVFVLITFSLTARFASEHPHWTLAEHYVVAGDRLVGMITRDHLLRVLAAKMELDVPGMTESDSRRMSNLPEASSTA